MLKNGVKVVKMQTEIKNRSKSAPKTVGKDTRETDVFGYPIGKALSKKEAMDYFNLRETPRQMAPKPKEQEDEKVGDNWVKTEKGLYVKKG